MVSANLIATTKGALTPKLSVTIRKVFYIGFVSVCYMLVHSADARFHGKLPL